MPNYQPIKTKKGSKAVFCKNVKNYALVFTNVGERANAIASPNSADKLVTLVREVLRSPYYRRTEGAEGEI